MSVARVVPGSVAHVAQAIGDARRRAAWLDGVAPELRRALEDAFGGPKPKRVTMRSTRDARLRYQWGRNRVELRIRGDREGHSSVVADTTRIVDATQLELRRAQWTVALEGLKGYLGTQVF